MVRVLFILSASTVTGACLFGATAYLLLVFGPDVNAAHFSPRQVCSSQV